MADAIIFQFSSDAVRRRVEELFKGFRDRRGLCAMTDPRGPAAPDRRRHGG